MPARRAVVIAGVLTAAGDVLTAVAHATRAVDMAEGRPTAWLADSILAQSTRAGGRSGYDRVASRVAGWPRTLTGPI